MSAEFPSPLAALVGPWVETRADRRGDGSRYVVAVNHRDRRATIVESDELAAFGPDASADIADVEHARAELLGHLRSEGFLLDRPAELDQPAPRLRPVARVAGVLRTLHVQWAGADRAVRWAHRHGLRHLFSPLALAAQVLLAVAGTVAVVRVLTSGNEIAWVAEPWMLPALLAIDVVAIAIHELGHALVLVHHRRSVAGAGVTLHLGSPAFYVDSVDGLLLPRRIRVAQVLAGPWAEWLVTGAVALIALQLPSGAAALVLHRFVVLNAITVLTNLLPFVGLDGYWLLADGLREPDPARRARLARADLADEITARRLPSASTLAWATYGALNRVVAAGFLAVAGVFWFQRFGSLVIGAFAAAPLLGAAVVAVLALLARPAALAARPPVARTCRRALRVAGRARFRTQRGWRVAATESLRQHPALAGLDELALGLVAGRLVRGRPADGLTVVVGGHEVGLRRADLDWIHDHRPVGPVAA